MGRAAAAPPPLEPLWERYQSAALKGAVPAAASKPDAVCACAAAAYASPACQSAAKAHCAKAGDGAAAFCKPVLGGLQALGGDVDTAAGVAEYLHKRCFPNDKLTDKPDWCPCLKVRVTRGGSAACTSGCAGCPAVCCVGRLGLARTRARPLWLPRTRRSAQAWLPASRPLPPPSSHPIWPPPQRTPQDAFSKECTLAKLGLCASKRSKVLCPGLTLAGGGLVTPEQTQLLLGYAQTDCGKNLMALTAPPSPAPAKPPSSPAAAKAPLPAAPDKPGAVPAKPSPSPGRAGKPAAPLPPGSPSAPVVVPLTTRRDGASCSAPPLDSLLAPLS